MAQAEDRFKLPAAAILLSFHFVFFLHAYISTDTFFLRDVSIVQTSLKQVALETLQLGELPIWIPSLSGGQPLLANPNYFTFHPGNLLVLLLGVITGLKFFVLSHYLLCSAGVYLLLRNLHPSPLPALFGAIAFPYCGFMCSLGNLMNSLAAASLLPWLLLATELLLVESRWLPLVLVAAIQIFAGEPVPAMLSFVLALGWAALRIGPGSRISRLGRTAAALGLGALVASPQVIPAIMLFLHSDRSGGLGAEQVFKWSLPPVRLLETVFPQLLGSPAYATAPAYLGGPWEDDGYPYIISVFLGPVPLLLAGIGFAVARAGRVLVAGAFLFGVMGLGDHLPVLPWLHGVAPFVAIFRYPSKLYLVVSFLLVVTAAYGLRHVVSNGRSVPAGGLGVLIALAGAAGLPALSSWVAAGHGPLSEPGAARMLLGSYPMVGITLAAGLVLLTHGRELIEGPLAGWILLGLHAVALLVSMPSLLPTVPRSFYDQVPPPVEFLTRRSTAEPSRIYWEPSTDSLALPRAPWLAPDPKTPGFTGEMALGQRQLGLEFVGRTHGLEYAFETGWEGVALAAIRKRTDRLQAAGESEYRQLLDDANVRYLLSFESHPEFALLKRFDGLERRPLYLYENPTVKSRVTPEGSTEILGQTPGSLTFRSHGNDAVRVAVNHYPLWRAQANGTELHVSADDDGWVRISGLEPGADQTVRLWLDPWDLRLGFAISGLGLLGALAMARFERRKSTTP